MDWSKSHKTKIIMSLSAILIVLIAIFVYFKFIKHEPTCSDGKKNQDEHGIDCGGMCQLMCMNEVKPLIPLWTRPFKITGDVYSVVSYIENQNMGNGVKSLPYEIRMYDDKNVLVTEPIKGTTFIGPNDRTAIFETAVKVGVRVPKTAYLKFMEPPTFLRISERYNDQNLVAEKDVFTDLDTVPKLSAVIRNKTLETFVKIPVVVIVYDTDGNILAASQTIIESIGPEESVTVNFSWPEPFAATPARREIIPRINPFIQAKDI